MGHRKPCLSLGISHRCQICKQRVENADFFILNVLNQESEMELNNFITQLMFNCYHLGLSLYSPIFSYYISEQRLVLQGCLADCCIINEACKEKKKELSKKNEQCIVVIVKGCALG